VGLGPGAGIVGATACPRGPAEWARGCTPGPTAGGQIFDTRITCRRARPSTLGSPKLFENHRTAAACSAERAAPLGGDPPR
jgi:hypothetical protein